MPCCAPTQDELENIQILWIDCHIEDLAIDDGQKPVRRKPCLRKSPESKLINPSAPTLIAIEEVAKQQPITTGADKKEQSVSTTQIQDTVEEHPDTVNLTTDQVDVVETPAKSRINWKLTLGHCPEVVVQQTLKNTTQYFAEPVESETRAYPRQHRAKRLLPLHVRRIPGRSCADTFFSSVRSVRGFTCVQLFVALFAHYIWVKCLRRESQVPAAYAEFCSEVGAPN